MHEPLARSRGRAFSFFGAGIAAILIGCGSGALSLGELDTRISRPNADGNDAGTGDSGPACGSLLGCDASTADDAAAPLDAGPVDAGPLSCPGTAAAACQGPDSGVSPPCYLEWAQASASCGGGAPQWTASCGAYDVVGDLGVDTSVQYFYDHATGQLAAVIDTGPVPGGATCLGGPQGGFHLPSCGPVTPCP
jgi:hypothetical protein